MAESFRGMRMPAWHGIAWDYVACGTVCAGPSGGSRPDPARAAGRFNFRGTPLQLVIQRVARNCPISMGKSHVWVWNLALSLPYPDQTLPGI